MTDHAPTVLLRTAEEFEELRRAVTTVEIPADLPRWHPNEISQWMTELAEDESVSVDDRRRAALAEAYALGIEPDDQEAEPVDPSELEPFHNRLEREGRRGRLDVGPDGTLVRLVHIPTDLDRWSPDEVKRWVKGYAEDEQVPAAEVSRAREAAAGVGVDLEEPADD
ncbi:hypothetical protein ACVW0K_007145 [Streptomyces filamentosus]